AVCATCVLAATTRAAVWWLLSADAAEHVLLAHAQLLPTAHLWPVLGRATSCDVALVASTSASLHNDGMKATLQFKGELLAIGVADKAKDPIQLRNTAEVVEGQGIVGDRYYEGRGAGQKGKAIKPEQHVTLIAAEAIDDACNESGLPITHQLTRRN